VSVFSGRAPLRRIAVLAALLLGGASVTLATAHAQSPKRTPVIGLLGTTPQSGRSLEGFKQGLREGGWVEGETVRLESRWAEGPPELVSELARDLVRLKVDVIVTPGSQATKAAKEATSTIPIVFVAVGNPVGAGFVASLARPGGNVTGVTNQLGDLTGKFLQLAREVVPRLRHLGIMWNPVAPSSALAFKEAQERYPTLGVKVTSVPVRSLEDFDGAFDVLSRERLDFLIVHPSPVIFRHRQRVAEFALRNRLPTSTGTRAMVDDASIMISYGPDFATLFRRAAVYIDKILRGARPADLPVEQPTRFDLVVNQRVARAIGLEFTPAFLARVDQVIE
jgi:putative ABC transport system substrate-binding protein